MRPPTSLAMLARPRVATDAGHAPMRPPTPQPRELLGHQLPQTASSSSQRTNGSAWLRVAQQPAEQWQKKVIE